MVVAVAGVAAIVVTGGAAAPLAAGAVEAASAATTAAAATAGAISGATTAAAAGAGAGGVLAGAATGAAVAGSTAAGVGAIETAAVTAGMASGPVGWMILGTSSNTTHKRQTENVSYTFDCWKAVVHDTSTEPSKGRFLRDVVCDPRVKLSMVKWNGKDQLPDIILHNIWGETFQVNYVTLPSQQLAAHAVRINAIAMIFE